MPTTYQLTLADRSNEFSFSAVNIWEIAIKRALGRPDFELGPELCRYQSKSVRPSSMAWATSRQSKGSR